STGIEKRLLKVNCLRQLDSKLDLQLHEKQLVHTLYFNHLSRLSNEKSIGQLLLNKIQAEIRTSAKIVSSSEITEFWKRKEESSYRKTLDGHTRKEKEYLSSLHLAKLQNDDDINKEFALIDVLIPGEDSKIVEDMNQTL
ncbi:17720_t:CDS:2, partial [Dentiscutata erythropus]